MMTGFSHLVSDFLAILRFSWQTRKNPASRSPIRNHNPRNVGGKDRRPVRNKSTVQSDQILLIFVTKFGRIRKESGDKNH